MIDYTSPDLLREASPTNRFSVVINTDGGVSASILMTKVCLGYNPETKTAMLMLNAYEASDGRMKEFHQNLAGNRVPVQISTFTKRGDLEKTINVSPVFTSMESITIADSASDGNPIPKVITMFGILGAQDTLEVMSLLGGNNGKPE